MSGNNVVAGDANNRSDVYTSCTNNNVSETHMDIYIGVCWILLHAAVQSDHRRDWWIRGHTLMVGGQHHGSSSGLPCECATPTVRTSGGSNGDMPQLLLHSN